MQQKTGETSVSPVFLPVMDETTSHSTKPRKRASRRLSRAGGNPVILNPGLIGGAVMKSLFIRAEWDAEAGVWVATSDDVPGLVAEAETEEQLLAKLHVLIPELLDANGYPDGGEVPFELFSRRFDVVQRKAA